MATQREMIAEILRQVTEDEVAEDNGMMHDAKNKKLMHKMRGNERVPMSQQGKMMSDEEHEEKYGNGSSSSSKNAVDC